MYKEFLTKDDLQFEQKVIGILSPHPVNIETVIVTPGLKKAIEEVLKTIPPRDAGIFTLFCEGKSLTEIGSGHHLTKEGVRQVVNKTIKILRHRTRFHQIIRRCLEEEQPQVFSNN